MEVNNLPGIEMEAASIGNPSDIETKTETDAAPSVHRSANTEVSEQVGDDHMDEIMKDNDSVPLDSGIEPVNEEVPTNEISDSPGAESVGITIPNPDTTPLETSPETESDCSAVMDTVASDFPAEQEVGHANTNSLSETDGSSASPHKIKALKMPSMFYPQPGFKLCRHKRYHIRKKLYKNPLVTIKYIKLKYQKIRLRSLKHRCHFVLWKLAELQRNSKQMKIDILRTAMRIMKKMSLSVRSWQEMAEMPIPLGRRPSIAVNVRLMVSDMNQLRKKWLTKTMSGMRLWTETLKKNSHDIKEACSKLRDYGLSEADWQCTLRMMQNTDEQIQTLEKTRIEIEDEITRSVLGDI